jgi:2-methylcitrate dehydratase
MTESFLKELAERCASSTFQTLSPRSIHQVKRAVLDSIGCALGAWRLGEQREVLSVLLALGGAPEATVWGAGIKAPAPTVALAVGTICSSLEYAAHCDVIPAAVAVAEMHHSDGRSLITALAAAFRTLTALKQVLAAGIEAHGLHWPGQLATFAAAAAACTLRGTTVEQTANALSLAGCVAPVAPFEAFTGGSGAKDVYGGWGGMAGVLAARLSQVGLGGPLNLVEGTRGLGRAWLHAAPPASELVSAISSAEDGWGSQIRFKPFPSCVSVHPSLSALEALLERYPDLNVDNIARIKVHTYPYAAELSNTSASETPIAARVHIPTLCATMLLRGEVDPEDVEVPSLLDPRLRELAAKVSVTAVGGSEDETGAVNGFSERIERTRENDPSARRRPARVTIVLRDGRHLEASVAAPKWAVGEPASDSELERKFERLVGDLMAAERRQALMHTIWQLEAVEDIADLVAYLTL